MSRKTRVTLRVVAFTLLALLTLAVTQDEACWGSDPPSFCRD